MMKRVIIAALLTLGFVAVGKAQFSMGPLNGGACSQSAPAQAAADGLVVLNFCDDFTYSNTGFIDFTGTDNKPWVDGLWYGGYAGGPGAYSLSGGTNLTITGGSSSVSASSEYKDTTGGRFYTPPFYAEARINGNNWLAFWFFSEAWTKGSCAYGGAAEIDVIETDTTAVNTAFTTVHESTSNECGVTDVIQDCYNNLPNGGSTQNQWHIYAVLADPANSRVDFYIDNTLVCHETGFTTTNQPYIMVLGIGPGGVNGGPPVGSASITTDWIRVFVR